MTVEGIQESQIAGIANEPETPSATKSAQTAATPATEPELLTAPAPSTSPADQLAEDELMAWRYRTLPMMQTLLYLVTAVFFISGLVELAYLQWSISQGAEVDRQQLPSLVSNLSDSSEADLLEAARFEAAMIMESYVVERRYHQANALLMTMAWIRYLSFSTGMILAIVGASFILGRLREQGTDLAAESAGWRLSLSSSSPGLIMVVLGVVLMFTAITYQQNFEFADYPTYLQGSALVQDRDAVAAPTRQGLIQPDGFPEE